jgi:predicted SAM-dependent methyltransferase
MFQLYQVHNPSAHGRTVFSGAQRAAVSIGPGETRHVKLDPKLVNHLITRYGLVIVDGNALFPPAEPQPAPPQVNGSAAPASKPPLVISGMFGIGDCLHQRAFLRTLMRTHDVHLESPHFLMYHDLVAQGLKVYLKPTRLHAQAKTIQREANLFAKGAPPIGAPRRRTGYHKIEIDRYGSIIAAQFGTSGAIMPKEPPDFSLPLKAEWRQSAAQLVAQWDLKGKPLLIYRPLTIRKEWDGAARNCDPDAYEALFKSIRGRYFVVSIGDLIPGQEDIVGNEQEADVKLHQGELDFPTMAALFEQADLVLSPAGFAPVLAQAVHTPTVIVYGRRESFKTTDAGGAHLAPTLGIEPDKTCDCHSQAHQCHACRPERAPNKRITLRPALKRLVQFVDLYARTRKDPPCSQKPPPAPAEPAASAPQITLPALGSDRAKILIFGTIYVDNSERDKLARHWINVHGTLNPACDLLLIDAPGPYIMRWPEKGVRNGYGAKFDVFCFPDNVGHLSRGQGRDGWGRAFCKGIELAIERGYEYAVHIEGDSLLRLPVTPFIDQMRKEGIEFASTEVRHETGAQNFWLETGLVFMKVEALRQPVYTSVPPTLSNRGLFIKNMYPVKLDQTLKDFVAAYDWQNRRRSPTPEIVIRKLFGERLKMLPIKTLRADKNRRVTSANLLTFDLDWITHFHDDTRSYDVFAKAALEGAAGLTKTEAPAPQPQAQPAAGVMINLGCGTNRLKGWQNHDADVDITKPLPWPDGSASHVLAEHVVEHVPLKSAIAFFKECHRVLGPGGILRIAVPSIERIWKSDDEDYFRFSQKWQNIGPTRRGAMHAILFSHGHEMAYTESVLQALLYYCGFDQVTSCQPGMSMHRELQGVEGHGRIIGAKFNSIETIVVEGIK